MNLTQIKLPSNKKFGLFFTAIFLLVTIFFYFKNNSFWFYIFCALFLIVLLITLINADILLPFNKLWMRFGFLLGIFISPIIMGFIFFGIFTPIAILMRLFGRDELNLKLKKRKTHWIKRNYDVTPESFKRQF